VRALAARLALAALVAIAGDAPAVFSARQPDLLLITLDTTRADRLGCYGYAKPTTPHIDQLAAAGVVFTRALAQATVTPVSHASIFTGLYPYTHGVRVMHGLTENRLADQHTTLAETLKGAGYRTAAFVSAFPVTERFGLHQGFDHFDADFMSGVTTPLVTPKGSVNTGPAQRRADATTDRALAWMAAGDRAAPRFVWLHYFDPHDPTIGPPESIMERYGHVKGSEPEVLRAIYDMEIMHVDDQIGRVVAALRDAGRLEQTIVVIVADHGEGLGDHDWWTHGLLYEEQVRVPLIVRAPSIPAGRRVAETVRTIDIVPTIHELIGIAAKDRPRVEGRSLVSLARGAGAASAAPPLVYCDSVNMLTYQFTPRIRDVKDDMLFAVVDGPWKYIHHLLHEEQSELYHTGDDPRELVNLYARQPKVVERMKRKLHELPFAPTDQMEDRNRMSPEDIERLRSLGYIGG
jgi:arylsulfatase A-like enzyme